jgi:hypothetical protein
MKKRFLTLIAGGLSLLSVSCSPENDVVTSSASGQNHSGFVTKSLPTKDLNDAVLLYTNMMGTQEYADLKASINAFNSKLYCNVDFETKEEWVDWIRVNLSATGFSSLTEFETLYDATAANATVLIDNNDTLFRFFENADSPQIGVITAPELGADPGTGLPVPTNACQFACMDAADLGYAANEANFNNRTAGLDIGETA